MNILGISCFYHDAAAALVRDGFLVAAAEEERFSRKKHDFGFPHLAIKFCLDQAGLKAGDVDYVIFYEKPFLKFERIFLTQLQGFPGTVDTFRRSMTNWLLDKLWVKQTLMSELELPAERILFSQHHLSPAASAFFCSPFKEAAVLTVDGVGEWTTTMLSHGRASWESPRPDDHESRGGQGRNELKLLSEIRFPHSLGLLYSVFTAFLGFEVNEGEYKVMGMAPYGTPRYVDKVWQVIHQDRDGSFSLDMDYFSYHRSAKQAYSRKFLKLFGEPRDRNAPFVTHEAWTRDATTRESDVRSSQHYADLGASIQRVTEEVMLNLARHAYEATHSPRLCLAGGVALNSVANGRILKETPFKEVFIQPAAGDSGGAVGAAFYAYHVLLQKPRRFVMEHAYWGQRYSEGEIASAVQRAHLSARSFDTDERLTQHAAQFLTEGKVVGWFQGAFEWGPRALGNRSILADPRREDMKAIVNHKIKFREPFRPFAPSMLDRAVPQYIELSNGQCTDPARFMLMVAPIQRDKRAKIPAVTHVDGTGRLQSVERRVNPLYYQLIEAFEAQTGVPVVLNTSFNLKGEPIVNTPDQAISTFQRSEMDALVLGHQVLTKG
jgi:carbamoyltransferase